MGDREGCRGHKTPQPIIRSPFDRTPLPRGRAGHPGPAAAEQGCSALPDAGSGLFHSAIHAVLNAVLHAALRDRFGPLPSVIDPAIDSFRVAGGSSGWQVAGLIHSVLHSVLNAVLHADLLGQICHQPSVIDSAILSSTRRHPYPWRPHLTDFEGQTRSARGTFPLAGC